MGRKRKGDGYNEGKYKDIPSFGQAMKLKQVIMLFGRLQICLKKQPKW